jgi:peptide/nickel transport system permease protein
MTARAMAPGGWPVRAGVALLLAVAVLVAAAPWIAPHASSDQFADKAYAPPMRIRVIDAGRVRSPFVYRQALQDRLLRTFGEDRSQPLSLRFFADGKLVSLPPGAGPLLLLGADPLGRDVFSRVLLGARLSLGVALAGVVGALLVGALAGGLAGATGGWIDRILMIIADAVVALPGAYLVLVLRGLLPRVISTGETFGLMALLFSVAAWPHAARGVRAIVALERTKDYAEAARASGAGPWRLVRHLLPAARGFLAVEVVLLIPALLVAEATVSFLNMGFPEPAASWGTMLQDAANVAVMSQAPWLLAPALALFVVVFGVQLLRATPPAEPPAAPAAAYRPTGVPRTR